MALKDKQTHVTYHKGVDTIGGTNIEIAYGDAHIFFDLGTEYRPELDLPDESYQTLIQNRLIPKLDDFYDEHLTGAPRWKEKFQHSAAFISHLHLDHTKMLNFVDQRIPVYSTPATIKLLKRLNRDGNFLLPAAGHPKEYLRPLTELPVHHKVKIGEIEVEFYPVDHDADGAVSFLIHTPDAFIVYTGDLRLHGYHPEWTRAMMKAAAGCDLLISEGVGVSFPQDLDKPRKPWSEQLLIEKLVALVENADGRPTTFNTYPGNISRLEAICDAQPRTVVLTADRAWLLQQITGRKVNYYYSPSAKMLPELDPSLEVDYQMLLADKDTYLWQVEDHFEDLQPNTLYIHSDAEPLGDFDPAYQKFLDMLAAHHVEFVRLACSGHATAAELDEIIAGIKPQLLTPIHSFHPENLKNPFGSRVLPQNGQTLVLH